MYRRTYKAYAVVFVSECVCKQERVLVMRRRKVLTRYCYRHKGTMIRINDEDIKYKIFSIQDKILVHMIKHDFLIINIPRYSFIQRITILFTLQQKYNAHCIFNDKQSGCFERNSHEAVGKFFRVTCFPSSQNSSTLSNVSIVAKVICRTHATTRFIYCFVYFVRYFVDIILKPFSPLLNVCECLVIRF